MARMTFGIDLHNRACMFFPRHGLDYDLGRLVDLAVLCEEVGFDSVSVGDSLLAKPRWRPIPTMAAIAARTRRITVASHILAPHYYHNPVILAQELATLDEISAGRVAVGCGIGAGRTEVVEAEYRAIGLPKARRGAIFEETLHLLRRLLTEEEVTHHGEFYRLDGVRIGLRPRQSPLPLWIAAGLFHAGVAGAGPYGDREGDQARRGWLVPHERERAYEQTRWFQREYHEMPVPEEVMRRWTIAGSADDVVRRLLAYERAGVQHFIICVRARDYFAQVRQLAAEILPAFR
jgi:alkanesulfonate monooxygenase SsuD/methylene tetrahydromethanopterin reductase-like flavin-dependent oxidoreductase (luciferase family)